MGMTNCAEMRGGPYVIPGKPGYLPECELHTEARIIVFVESHALLNAIVGDGVIPSMFEGIIFITGKAWV